MPLPLKRKNCVVVAYSSSTAKRNSAVLRNATAGCSVSCRRRRCKRSVREVIQVVGDDELADTSCRNCIDGNPSAWSTTAQEAGE